MNHRPLFVSRKLLLVSWMALLQTGRSQERLRARTTSTESAFVEGSRDTLRQKEDDFDAFFDSSFEKEESAQVQDDIGGDVLPAHSGQDDLKLEDHRSLLSSGIKAGGGIFNAGGSPDKPIPRPRPPSRPVPIVSAPTKKGYLAVPSKSPQPSRSIEPTRKGNLNPPTPTRYFIVQGNFPTKPVTSGGSGRGPQPTPPIPPGAPPFVYSGEFIVKEVIVAPPQSAPSTLNIQVNNPTPSSLNLQVNNPTPSSLNLQVNNPTPSSGSSGSSGSIATSTGDTVLNLVVAKESGSNTVYVNSVLNGVETPTTTVTTACQKPTVFLDNPPPTGSPGSACSSSDGCKNSYCELDLQCFGETGPQGVCVDDGTIRISLFSQNENYHLYVILPSKEEISPSNICSPASGAQLTIVSTPSYAGQFVDNFIVDRPQNGDYIYFVKYDGAGVPSDPYVIKTAYGATPAGVSGEDYLNAVTGRGKAFVVKYPPPSITG